MKQARMILAAGAFLVLGGAGAALYEWVPVQSKPEWSPEARRNPLLAAGRLLERRGWKVNFQSSPTGVPPDGGTLFLAMDSSTLPAAMPAPLLAWVQRGNRLVVPARYLGDPENGVRDPLLSPLSVVLHDSELEDGGSPLDGDKEKRRLDVDDDTHWLITDFSPRFSLEDASGNAVLDWSDQAGTHVLSYPYGKGVIHVLSDTGLFKNNVIHRHDNAAVWLRLFETEDGNAAGQVWLVYGGESTGILALIWRYAPQAVISGLVVLLALVWLGNTRFGPLLPSPQSPRRRLGEHLLAAGRYHWFNGGRERLYQASRQRLRHYLQLRHPQWRGLPDAQLATELQQRTGLDAAAILQALNGPAHHDLARFLRDMRTLHQLRKQT